MPDPHQDRIVDPLRLAAVRATGLLDTGAEDAFDGLGQLAATLLAAPYAFVTLVDERRSFWKACIGVDTDDLAQRQNRVEDSFCQYVVTSCEPLIVGDVTANPLTASNPSIEAMGVAAWAGYPLWSPEGQVLGSFCVVDTVVRTWTDRDVEVLRVLSLAAARELALRDAVAAAHLAVAERDALNEQLGLLSRVGQALTETLDAEEAVTRLARLVVPLLGDWAIVSVIGPDDEMRDLGWWHADPQRRPLVDKLAGARLEGLAGRGATHQAWRSLEPVVLTTGALEAGLDVLASEQAKDALVALDPGSYAVFPLVAGDRVGGVLAVLRDASRAPMTEVEIAVAVGVAQRGGMALENARLFAQQESTSARLREANRRLRRIAHHDRIVSRALQDAMLTRLPEPDHIHVAARYLTADGADQVGGDWYDAIVPPSGATTVMVGDVSGHDIAAATVMGQLRNMLRAFAWDRHEDPPARLIARLDAAMADLHVGSMTTLTVTRIEQGEADRAAGLRTVRWSSAGHPAPVLLDPEGTARLLTGAVDPPLGVVRGATRHDHSARIAAGATLLLYTDGLIETRALDIDERQAELVETVGALADQSLDDLLDGVLARMVGPDPADDVALLAVRFHPEDRPRPAEAGPADTAG